MAELAAFKAERDQIKVKLPRGETFVAGFGDN
jgi:hypothetical protein